MEGGRILNLHLGRRASGENRTLDPSLTKRLLCHLSYAGLEEFNVLWDLVPSRSLIIPVGSNAWQEITAKA